MATIRDVAEKAGVSVATVSHVINGTRRVAPQTAERIRSAMQELDYQPNSLAQSLRTRRTNVVWVLVSDISNPFFATFVRGAEDAAIEAGYSLIVCNSDESAAREEQYIRLLRQRRVDGLLVSPVGDGSGAPIRAIARSKTPYVFVDRKPEFVPGDAVLSENVDGAEKATQHLLGRGHTRIGLILGIPGATTTEERLTGYQIALEAAGIPYDASLVSYGSYRIEGGKRAASALLSFAEAPTALFSTNNLMTIGVLREIGQRGLEIPDDVAVIGFDDLVWAEMVTPRLTTVCQDPYEIGKEAMHLLLERMQGRGGTERREIRMPVELRVRESA